MIAEFISNLNLVSILIGVAVAMVLINLIQMFRARYRRNIARKNLADAKSKMALIDKELKEKEKQLNEALKQSFKK